MALHPRGAPPNPHTPGARHSCALVDGQRIVCWGSNDQGQIDGMTPGISRTVTVKL